MLNNNILYFTFLTLHALIFLINCQEYLKELKAKEFKLIAQNELPPVELPRPIIPQRIARVANDETTEDLESTKSYSCLQKTHRPTFMDVALQASVREGLNAMKQLYLEIEPNMIKNGEVLEENHPGALLSKFNAPVVETNAGEMAAYASLTAFKAFRKNYNVNHELARQAHSEKVSLRRTALETMCPVRDPPTCMPASERYRTHDGTCNNKKRPRWGAAHMPFNRFLPPEYGDGVDTIRNAVDGGPLSSSRFVSLLVHGAREGEAPLTLMLAQWGQLLDHDLTSTAQPRSINGSVPSCCGSRNFHPSCFPIKVPLDDPWLSPLKVRCLEFLRSAAAQRRDCVLSWREQTNQVTSFIDASPIYSSNVKSSDTARIFRKGLLIFGRGNPADDVCQRGAIATHCIRSGDGRSGEQPGLLALHHVWVHEHNHIAMKLSEMNTHWSDEKIYQETRRIIGAMFQHITYREFLPIVLGREVLKLFDLELLTSGYYEGYDPKINPTVANAFSAAAFRFGHSLIQNSYIRCDRFHNILNSNVSLHEEFQRGDIGSAGSLHRLLRGLATQRALKRDEFITPELTNHLFQTPGFPFGLDLAAINVQRGRDHGIPPYTNWRVPCGLSPINTWEEFANIVGAESAQRISHAYHSVHDIDLFVGGISERPVVGGLVGPTFACIIAQQFSNSRKGDRFWYENAGFENSFTPAQLHAIRRVSLASILCRAVDGGTFQPHIFLPPQFQNNERLPCGAPPLNDFDIEPWLEQDPFNALASAQTALQPPLLPTFKPQILTDMFETLPLTDRIFDITHLEAQLPQIANTPLSDNKVGFSNRKPAITLIRNPPKPVQSDFITNISNNLLSDKLDIKKPGTSEHVTKQKPVPGVNNKLDKDLRKNINRLGLMHNTTRRTAIIVNNIPIELRNAGKGKHETVAVDNEPEPRTSGTGIAANTERTEHSRIEIMHKTLSPPETNAKTDNLQKTNATKTVESKSNQNKNEVQTKCETKIVIGTETQKKRKTEHSQPTKGCGIAKPFLNKTQSLMDHKNTITFPSNQTKPQLNKANQQKGFKNLTNTEILFTEMNTLKEPYDSDIDPMAQATPIEHKRVQRKAIPVGLTGQLQEKFQPVTIKNETKITKKSNRTLTTTKSSKLSRTTARTVELRQYQNRPSFTKSPQKVILDAVNGNGGNQYEIEINIRQTNKNPKPIQSTPYTTNYRPNQYERYTTSYQTTPFYGYYQSPQTHISTQTYNQATKRPTIIFVNEHEEHTSAKQPGLLPSIVGWNSGTKRPFPAAIGFNERPGFENVIASPHSTAYKQPSSQKPPVQFALPYGASSFSQAHADTNGIVQASSASISNGNFGSIAGFASASGTDSTFSFNIRPKPDKTYNNPGSYDLQQPSRNPWYEQPDATGHHISTYDMPYRENTNSPFSTYNNAQKYYVRHKTRKPQRKNILTLTPTHDYGDDYDYALRLLQPLGNITSEEKIDVEDQNVHREAGEDADEYEDYAYDEDYGTSPLLKKFNRDGYLRPEHMTETLQKTSNDTTEINSLHFTTHNHKQTLDDNYVLPVLNSTIELKRDLSTNTVNSVNKNFSFEFSDALPKHLLTEIFAEEDVDKTFKNFTNDNQKDNGNISRVKVNVLRELQRKRNKNRIKSNTRQHETIAFAPLNILTKPERPDNWVFFNKPHKEEPLLPQIPELNEELVRSLEIPKPLKQNIWLDLTKFKKKNSLQTNTTLKLNTVIKADTNKIQEIELKTQDSQNNDTFNDLITAETQKD